MQQQPYQFQWTKGDLSEGFASYEQHLGLARGQAVFINDLVVNPRGATWRMTDTDGLDRDSTAYTISLSAKGVTALHLPLTANQQKYVSTYLQEGGQLLPIALPEDSRDYPKASIVHAVLHGQDYQPVREQITGKVIVNSYVTEDVEALAAQTGAKVLMDNPTFLKFVGKEYLHQVADEAGFKVAPGRVITHPDQVAGAADSFRGLLAEMGKDPDSMKVWIKPTSLSGGQGVISKPDAKPETLHDAFMTIAKAYKDCGYYADNEAPVDPAAPFKGIERFMPIVLEADIGSLPGVVRKLDDAGVKAIIGDQGVVHIENTLLSTKGGEYLGSRLPQAEDAPVIGPAEVAADKLMQKMWKDGYRGYISVNAVVVEKQDGSIDAYMNDINTRLSGASPLLGLAHKAMKKLGYRPHAFSLTGKLDLPEGCADAFDVVADKLGANLYRGAETGYTGIVPAVVNVHGDKVKYRAVAIARDAQHLQELRAALK
jgi:hypothetical protein